MVLCIPFEFAFDMRDSVMAMNVGRMWNKSNAIIVKSDTNANINSMRMSSETHKKYAIRLCFITNSLSLSFSFSATHRKLERAREKIVFEHKKYIAYIA